MSGAPARVILLLALAFAAASPAPARVDAGPAPARGSEPPSGLNQRAPLAVAAGEVSLAEEQREGVADRSHPGRYVLRRLPPESLVAALIESTSVENVTRTMERLEAYGTRYVSTDSCAAAGLWIRDRLLEYGYTDVRIDTFRTCTWQDSVDAFNVTAWKEGSVTPSEHVILGGHYDSVTSDNFADPDAPAPGAEDNATGVAGVLEAARILADMETERSIVFACWSAEEEGLWGSRAFVADAVAESLDIVLYLNMDAIGYLAPPAPDALIMADTSALAVAGWMCDVAREHLGYDFEPVVQPLGASDHNSFWEEGYNVVDSQVEPTSHYMHTPDDVIENTSPEFAAAIAAVNVVATAAVAGIVGEDPNLPPETTLVANCETGCDPVSTCPAFEWESVDFDGAIAGHEFSLSSAGGEDTWTLVSGDQLSVSFSDLDAGGYEFKVRALDDSGLRDPSPAAHSFTVCDTLAPRLVVDTNFLPEPLVFEGCLERRAQVRLPLQSVYENERLLFRISCDASGYCGTAETVAVAVGDTFSWTPWSESPYEFVLRPSAEDTVIYFRTRDESGGATSGGIRLETVPATLDLPLLHVDDWFGGSVPEATQDAFYADLLSGHEAVEWDPLDHVEGGAPTIPSMEELGRYRTVMWTVGPGFEFLRSAQAESEYHYLEGYVRAGGNFILEGRSSLTSLLGLDVYHYDPDRPLPQFVVNQVGVDSMRNAGMVTNPSHPETYGWAFLGGIAVPGTPFAHVPVDTLGKWYENYVQFGGIPQCEVARTTAGTSRLYLFDSFLNPTLHELPCATMRRSTDGTGLFAYFGFPLYYLKDAQAREMVNSLFLEIESWQEPAELLFFLVDPEPRSVTLTWYLDPPDGPDGCHIERAPSGSGDGYTRLNDELIRRGVGDRFTFVDGGVASGSSYSYRLRVVEKWGGETLHGPWTASLPDTARTAVLFPPAPNPASREVAVRYAVGRDHSWVDIAVHDCAGRKIRTLRKGSADAGEYSVTWDGKDAGGQAVAAGVYFLRARLGDHSLHRKIVLLR